MLCGHGTSISASERRNRQETGTSLSSSWERQLLGSSSDGTVVAESL